MDIVEICALLASTLFLFVAPGYMLLRVFRPKIGFVEKVVMSAALSLAIISILTLILDFLGMINRFFLIITFSFVLVLFLVIGFVRDNGFSHLLDFDILALLRSNSVLILGLALDLLLALTNWQSAFGINSIDMGTHVFWANEILKTQHIPNYAVVEPLDQASRFTFGPHVVLAEFSAISQISLEQAFWVPSLFFSIVSLLTIFVLALKITTSAHAGAMAAILYGTAFLPGGFIQRGNISDVIGYFLMLTLVYLIVEIKVEQLHSQGWVILSGGLIIISVPVFHAYWALSALIVFLSFFFLVSIFLRTGIISLLKSFVIERNFLCYWIILLIVGIVTVQKLPYFSLNSVGQLQSGNWASYVTPIEDYPSLIGMVTLALGILGMLIPWSRHLRAKLVFVSWFATLFLLANGPRVGINVEAPRFLWRMTEPFSIAAAVGAYSIVHLLTSKLQMRWNLKVLRIHIEYTSGNARRILKVLLLIIFCFLVSAQAFEPIAFPGRYATKEIYYKTDKELGFWLARNSNQTDVIAVNADIDNTATWIQTFASRPHFLYKVDFASRVAVLPYRKIFQDISNLYENASSSTEVLDILKKYEVSYVVAHGPDVSKFTMSPFFTTVYVINQAVIFKSVLRSSYGEVRNAEGWLLNTASEKQIALLTELEIDYYASENISLTLPIYSHITNPPIPTSGFVAYVDGNVCERRLIEDGTISDIHTDYSKFWPNLLQSGVGSLYVLEIRLDKGTHSIRLLKTSDADFEVYLSDMVSEGIVFDSTFLHS